MQNVDVCWQEEDKNAQYREPETTEWELKKEGRLPVLYAHLEAVQYGSFQKEG